jgi:hypothetical protein
MAWKLVLFGVSAVSGAGLAVAAEFFPPSVGTPPAELLRPERPRVQKDETPFRGVVTEIGADWVELGAGWTGSDRTKEKWMKENKKPKRISAAGTIPGGDPKGDGPRATYRLTDLKVGDVAQVWVGIGTDGEEWCREIKIYRRPGGTIPPRPGEVRSDLNGWHMEMQAEQDWEEKGTPIPAKFLRDGRYPWTNPPYPPVAPQPRPAKP